MKEKIDNTIVGDFYNPLSTRSSRLTINQEIIDFNYILGQMDQTDIYKTFHLTAEEYAFSNAQKTFSRIHHMQVTKQVLTNVKTQSRWWRRLVLCSPLFINTKIMTKLQKNQPGEPLEDQLNVTRTKAINKRPHLDQLERQRLDSGWSHTHV